MVRARMQDPFGEIFRHFKAKAPQTKEKLLIWICKYTNN